MSAELKNQLITFLKELQHAQVALPQGGFAKPSRYYMLTEDQCYS